MIKLFTLSVKTEVMNKTLSVSPALFDFDPAFKVNLYPKKLFL